MTSTIAIIGRPNVGKSTLFNYLTRSRNALVVDQPGVTRDRQYGIAEYNDRIYLLIDTGGLYDVNETNQSIAGIISEQSLNAAREADAVFWLIDGRTELSTIDETIAGELRQENIQFYLLVNKTEGLDTDTTCAEFYSLGVDRLFPISAKRGSGIPSLMTAVGNEVKDLGKPLTEIPSGLRICLIGRPNVGKSTLTNRILGEERMLTYAQPGTTRDSINIPFQRDSKDYVLIDTAGVRRKSRVNDTIEKFSVMKTLEAMEQSHIVILILDAQEAVTDQDLSLLGLTIESGKSLMIAINKWDGLDTDQKRRIRSQVDRKLDFANYAAIHYISALHGTGVGKLFNSIDKIGKAQSVTIKPSRLTSILHDAVETHPPPLIHGRRIKLRYAHLGGHNPFRIIIHGNQTDRVPLSYQRYLANTFREQLNLSGTPVVIEFKHGENPYKGKKNILTKRQIAKRKRLMKHVKK